MDAYERLKILSSQMHLEPSEDASCPQLPNNKQDKISVSNAILPNGKHISLLKTQLSTACERNCYYCPFRAGRDFVRASFKPDEFAKVFMSLFHARIAEGIFLSSAIVNNGIYTQDKIINTADILRNKLGFRGYIHLKIMPGAEYSQVERAMQLADRVSINLEAPTASTLEKLAPRKQFLEELLQPLKWIHQIRISDPGNKGWNQRWPSSSTQFVVSAVGETDTELMTTTEYLYKKLHLKRAYYSSFNPIQDTPFENVPAGSPKREHRLYEASFLLRDYGFSMEELPFDSGGYLPIDIDPKLAWARLNLLDHPIEINKADKQTLLRIPGIGVKTACAIINCREKTVLNKVSDLNLLGVNLNRAAPFIQINGKYTAFQTAFF